MVGCNSTSNDLKGPRPSSREPASPNDWALARLETLTLPTLPGPESRHNPAQDTCASIGSGVAEQSKTVWDQTQPYKERGAPVRTATVGPAGTPPSGSSIWLTRPRCGRFISSSTGLGAGIWESVDGIHPVRGNQGTIDAGRRAHKQTANSPRISKCQLSSEPRISENASWALRYPLHRIPSSQLLLLPQAPRELQNGNRRHKTSRNSPSVFPLTLPPDSQQTKPLGANARPLSHDDKTATFTFIHVNDSRGAPGSASSPSGGRLSTSL